MSVVVWRDSSQSPASRSSCSELEHQRAGRADRDAVAAVDARRVRQRVGVLGRDARVEAAAGDGDGEGVLPLVAAGVDALVTEDALGVVAHVEVVVDLDRLRARSRRSGRRAPRGGRCARCRARGPAAPAARSARARRRSAGGRPARPARSTGRPRRPGTPCTILRLVADALGVGACTTMSASTLREHAGARTRAPSISTTQTRQTLAGAACRRSRASACRSRAARRRRGSSRPPGPRRAGRRS